MVAVGTSITDRPPHRTLSFPSWVEDWRDTPKPNSNWSDKAKELHKQLLNLTQHQRFSVFNYSPDYTNRVEASSDGKISITYSSGY